MNLKKRFKLTLLLLLLALLIFPAGGIKAIAAPLTGSLTITDKDENPKTSSTYSAYQIASIGDIKIDPDTNKYIYTNITLKDNYKQTIINAVGLTGNPSNFDILNELSKLDNDKTAALAIALKGNISTDTPKTSDKGVFKDIEYGYYLVIETANNANDGTIVSKPILVAVPDAITGNHKVTVKVKTSKAAIEKKIVEDNKLYDSSTAAVGDTITYQSISDIPAYSSDAAGITYYVTDTFSKGLDFKENSLQAKLVNAVDGSLVQNLTLGTDYTLVPSKVGEETNFVLTLSNPDSIRNWGNASYKLVITYNAELNKDASYGSTGNPNSVMLSYKISSGIYNSDYDTVITYTTKLIIKKTDTKGNALKDAEFKLSINNKSTGAWDEVDTVKTNDQGSATFYKLKQGIYQLVETKAPTDYELLKDPIEFTVTAKNGSTQIPDNSIIVTEIGNANAAAKFKATWECLNSKFSVDNGILNTTILNAKGFILPGTGGIGTTIFKVCGIVLIILGCSMGLVYFKRTRHMSNAK